MIEVIWKKDVRVSGQTRFTESPLQTRVLDGKIQSD